MAGSTMDTQYDHELIKLLLCNVNMLAARCDTLTSKCEALTTRCDTLERMNGGLSTEAKKAKPITNGVVSEQSNGHPEAVDFTQELAEAIKERFLLTESKLEDLSGARHNCASNLTELFERVQKLENKTPVKDIKGAPPSPEADSSPRPRIVRGADEPGSHWPIYLQDQIDRLKTKLDGGMNRIDEFGLGLKSTTELVASLSETAFEPKHTTNGWSNGNNTSKPPTHYHAEVLSAIKSRLTKIEKEDAAFVDQRRQERLIDDTRQQAALVDIFCALDAMRTPTDEHHVAGMFAGTSIQLEALQNRCVRRLALLESTMDWMEFCRKRADKLRK